MAMTVNVTDAATEYINEPALLFMSTPDLSNGASILCEYE